MSGKSYRAVARDFETTASAVYRHIANHKRIEQPVDSVGAIVVGTARAVAQPALSNITPIFSRGQTSRQRTKSELSPGSTLGDGYPGPCALCGSKAWRLLMDGRIMCSFCVPLRPRL